MKLSLIAVSLFLAASATYAEVPWTGGNIPMVFSGTDVGQALKALGLRTNTGIVYAAGKEKISITLNVSASTPEEAVRCVASAAGLLYRRVGKLYVVAPPGGMRAALEPYAVRVAFVPTAGSATELVPLLQETLPYATVRAAGDKIVVIGIAEDVEAARVTLQDFDSGQTSNRPAADVVLLQRVAASQIAPLVAGLHPDVKVTASPGELPGGALALAGPAAAVQAARATAVRLDTNMGPEPATLEIYNLRYSSAPSVMEFLKQAAPNVEAIAGPEAYSPGRATFSPLTAGMSSGSGYFGGGASSGSSSGASGGSSAGGSTGAPTGSGAPAAQPVSNAKTVILKGSRADVDNALKLLAQVDRKPRQVIVEVNVVETSPEFDESIGLKYDWTSFDFYEATRGTVVSGAFDATKRGGFGRFSRTPWNFKATLNLMVTNKQAKILAKPSIQVIDNGQASVFVGDTIRARLVSAGSLGAQTIDIKEFPVGIILLIAPRVNADGNITMHVNPVISSVTGIDSDNVPQTSAREAETTAIVKSGETVVLGGLIREQDTKTVQEVPFLSKLPLVGQLFRNRARNNRRNEIIVTITPHLVDDEEPAVGRKG